MAENSKDKKNKLNNELSNNDNDNDINNISFSNSNTNLNLNQNYKNQSKEKDNIDIEINLDQNFKRIKSKYFHKNFSDEIYKGNFKDPYTFLYEEKEKENKKKEK